MSIQETVRNAIARGWIRPASQCEPHEEEKKPQSRAAQMALRSERIKAGLNTHTGLPLMRRKHPDLAGLSRRDYMREYEKRRIK